jgi:quercetin dioxygenase-like cupin family protein
MPTPEPLPGAEPYVLGKDTGVTDVWFPVTGGRWTIKLSSDQTEGRLQVLLGREPRGATPMHVHHTEDECAFILEGELTLVLEDKRIDAHPGDFVFAPKGVPHAFMVTSDYAELLVALGPGGVQGPAGCGLNGLFRETGVPVVEGEPSPGKIEPDHDLFSRITNGYQMEITGPPPTPR